MASLATQPADVVKTHIQIRPSHWSTADAVRYIYTVRLRSADSPDCCFSAFFLKYHCMVLTLSVLPSGTRPGRVFPRGRAQVVATHPDGRHGLDCLRAADGSNGPQILRSDKLKRSAAETKGVLSLEGSTTAGRNFQETARDCDERKPGRKAPPLCVRVVVCAFFSSFSTWEAAPSVAGMKPDDML